MVYPASSAIATAAVFFAIGLVTLGLRFWVRLRIRPTYIGVDDWLIVLATILVGGMVANQIILAVLGTVGRDDQMPTLSRLLVTAKSTWAEHIIEKLAYGLLKLSVLFFYRRAFPVSKFLKQTNVLIGIVIVWTVSFFLSEVFACGVHPDVQWMDLIWKSNHGYHCTNESLVLLWFAVTDVLTDILILSMPYPSIKKLCISSWEKLQLGACFALGFLSFVAGLVRLGYVCYAFATEWPEINNSKPPTATFVWTTIEVTFGVIAVNLPSLAPLLRKSPNPKSLGSFLRHKLSTSSPQASSNQSPFATKGSRRKGSDRTPLTQPPAVSLASMGTKDLHVSAMIRNAGLSTDTDTQASRVNEDMV